MSKKHIKLILKKSEKKPRKALKLVFQVLIKYGCKKTYKSNAGTLYIHGHFCFNGTCRQTFEKKEKNSIGGDENKKVKSIHLLIMHTCVCSCKYFQISCLTLINKYSLFLCNIK